MAAEKKGGSGKKRKVKKTKQTAQKRAVAKAERKAKAAGKTATAEDIDAGEALLAAMQALLHRLQVWAALPCNM